MTDWRKRIRSAGSLSRGCGGGCSVGGDAGGTGVGGHRIGCGAREHGTEGVVAGTTLVADSAALQIDPWPVRTTSGFKLKPGYPEVGPYHPDFYENYADIGKFPGTEGLDSRRLWTSFLKTFGKGTTPLL